MLRISLDSIKPESTLVWFSCSRTDCWIVRLLRIGMPFTFCPESELISICRASVASPFGCMREVACILSPKSTYSEPG